MQYSFTAKVSHNSLESRMQLGAIQEQNSHHRPITISRPSPYLSPCGPYTVILFVESRMQLYWEHLIYVTNLISSFKIVLFVIVNKYYSLWEKYFTLQTIKNIIDINNE